MGLARFLAMLLHELGVANGMKEDDDSATAMINRINPKPTPGGITGIRYVVCCPCGEIIAIQASPQPVPSDELDELVKKHPEAHVVDYTEGSGRMKLLVSSRSHTVDMCDGCGNKFIVAWEMECVSIGKGLIVPWGDPEVPDSPASGLSFSKSVDGEETVH